MPPMPNSMPHSAAPPPPPPPPPHRRRPRLLLQDLAPVHQTPSHAAAARPAPPTPPPTLDVACEVRARPRTRSPCPVAPGLLPEDESPRGAEALTEGPPTPVGEDLEDRRHRSYWISEPTWRYLESVCQTFRTCAVAISGLCLYLALSVFLLSLPAPARANHVVFEQIRRAGRGPFPHSRQDSPSTYPLSRLTCINTTPLFMNSKKSFRE
jgi:hypothetical protein